MTQSGKVAPLSYLLLDLPGILNAPGWSSIPALCVHAALFDTVWPFSAWRSRRYCKPETNNESFDKGLQRVIVDLNSILTVAFVV